MSASPTPSRKRDAAIYRKAALAIEEGRENFSCCAISLASGCGGGQSTGDLSVVPHVRRYINLMTDYPEDPIMQRKMNYLQLDMDGQDHRIVCLCFMAAMVEAGDA